MRGRRQREAGRATDPLIITCQENLLFVQQISLKMQNFGLKACHTSELNLQLPVGKLRLLFRRAIHYQMSYAAIRMIGPKLCFLNNIERRTPVLVVPMS